MTAVIVSRKKIPLCSLLFILSAVIDLPHINALQYTPQNHRIIAEDTADNDIFCTDDVNECPDGTFVSRDPNNGCNFEPCSDNDVVEDKEEEAAAAAEQHAATQQQQIRKLQKRLKAMTLTNGEQAESLRRLHAQREISFHR